LAFIVCSYSATKGSKIRKPSSMLKEFSSAGTGVPTGKGPVSVGKNVRNNRASRLVSFNAFAVKDEPLGKVSVRNTHLSRETISGGSHGEPSLWEAPILLYNDRSS